MPSGGFDLIVEALADFSLVVLRVDLPSMQIRHIYYI